MSNHEQEVIDYIKEHGECLWADFEWNGTYTEELLNKMVKDGLIVMKDNGPYHPTYVLKE